MPTTNPAVLAFQVAYNQAGTGKLSPLRPTGMCDPRTRDALSSSLTPPFAIATFQKVWNSNPANSAKKLTVTGTMSPELRGLAIHLCNGAQMGAGVPSTGYERLASAGRDLLTSDAQRDGWDIALAHAQGALPQVQTYGAVQRMTPDQLKGYYAGVAFSRGVPHVLSGMQKAGRLAATSLAAHGYGLPRIGFIPPQFMAIRLPHRGDAWHGGTASWGQDDGSGDSSGDSSSSDGSSDGSVDTSGGDGSLSSDASGAASDLSSTASDASGTLSGYASQAQGTVSSVASTAGSLASQAQGAVSSVASTAGSLASTAQGAANAVTGGGSTTAPASAPDESTSAPVPPPAPLPAGSMPGPLVPPPPVPAIPFMPVPPGAINLYGSDTTGWNLAAMQDASQPGTGIQGAINKQVSQAGMAIATGTPPSSPQEAAAMKTVAMLASGMAIGIGAPALPGPAAAQALAVPLSNPVAASAIPPSTATTVSIWGRIAAWLKAHGI